MNELKSYIQDRIQCLRNVANKGDLGVKSDTYKKIDELLLILKKINEIEFNQYR